MNTRNFSNTSNIRRNIASSPKYGVKGSFPIDQTPSMSFNINPDTGRPMSDVQRLVKIQDQVNQQALFASLKDYKSSYLPSDMSDEDALTFIKSRYCQTRSQILDYKESLAKYQLDKENAAKSAALEKEKQDRYQSMIDDLFKKSESKS